MSRARALAGPHREGTCQRRESAACGAPEIELPCRPADRGQPRACPPDCHGGRGELVCHVVYVPSGGAHAWRSSRRRIANGELPLTDFGLVIASNPGLKPAPETLDLLRRKYGFDA